MKLIIDHTFTRPTVAAWWDSVPALHDSGTAFKRWIQSIPGEATRLDRKAAYDAIIKLVVPHHPIAEDLATLCILRKPLGRR